MRHVLRTALLSATLLGIAALPAAVLAQSPSADEPQRQLGAHAHGAGKLGIAIEGRTVEIELEAPGSDIVGFEHSAKTAEQKKAVSQARALLAKPMALFKLPEAAGCKVASAKVKLVGGSHAHSHGHSHGNTKATSAKPKEAETHSEFHAEYRLTCAKPDQIRSVELEYFKTFPRAESLEVSLIGAKGQAKQKATRDKPRIEIGGGS